MEHGTLPVIDREGKNIGTGYIVRDFDAPGDDVLMVNEDYVIPVNVTEIKHIINFSNVEMPNQYWRLEV